MKRLLMTFLIFIMTACNEEEIDSNTSLKDRWRMYSIRILELDEPSAHNACDYKTQISDLYGVSNISDCESDDIYEFTKNDELIIRTGDKRCTLSQSDIITKSYTQKGDSVTINGLPHYVVLLTSDTLILDYCDALTAQPTYKAKIGMKFIREK